ncbi:MAG TPA: glycosyltransferase family 9 protein [Candidatus Krumholzibacteria bacterium]|nr:glycosyltransferase family 9 protein [Candidatus Krumholzibacteria bacterium]
MTWTLDGRPLRRVLVTRLRYLGDVVMATVVADALKAGDPDVEVGFLCEAGHAEVLVGHPSLDRIHRLGAARRGADAAARAPVTGAPTARGTAGTVIDLARTRYDLAVDLFFNPRSAWLLRLAGIPQRIGGTAGSRRRLYTHAVPRRAVEDPRDVLGRRAPGGLGEHLCRLAPLRQAPTGQPFLAWLDGWAAGHPVLPHLPRRNAGEPAQAALAGVALAPGDRYVLLAPGATWPAKEWPAAHWSALAPAVERRTGLPVVTLVPPGREGAWPDLPRRLPVLPLAAVLDLVSSAAALVTVDGGVMHAGVALGVPVLALFGPTDPGIWFPYGAAPEARVLATRPACHPCSRHACPDAEFVCLPGLDPAAVLDALVGLAGSPARGRRG